MCHLLSDSQYGFRAHRSTSTALMELTEITGCIDDKKYEVGFFIDLKRVMGFSYSVTLSGYLDWK